MSLYKLVINVCLLNLFFGPTFLFLIVIFILEYFVLKFNPTKTQSKVVPIETKLSIWIIRGVKEMG